MFWFHHVDQEGKRKIQKCVVSSFHYFDIFLLNVFFILISLYFSPLNYLALF